MDTIYTRSFTQLRNGSARMKAGLIISSCACLYVCDGGYVKKKREGAEKHQQCSRDELHQLTYSTYRGIITDTYIHTPTHGHTHNTDVLSFAHSPGRLGNAKEEVLNTAGESTTPRSCATVASTVAVNPSASSLNYARIPLFTLFFSSVCAVHALPATPSKERKGGGICVVH
jgi:hypothetical protein